MQRGNGSRAQQPNHQQVIWSHQTKARLLCLVLSGGARSHARGTDNAPVFPDVWRQIKSLIHGLTLVAHNSPFDEGCLRAVFEVYQMDYPDYQFICTCHASRRHFGQQLPNHQLHTVAEACGCPMTNHHHALADAEACARIALRLL